MLGGYSVVAGVINRRFSPQPPIDRRQVSAWHKRGTWNQASQPPPPPARVLDQPPRTQPRFLFDTADWVEWFREGIPGPRGKGWRVYAEVSGDEGSPADAEPPLDLAS